MKPEVQLESPALSAAPPAVAPEGRSWLLCCVAIVLLGIVGYWNSFKGVFLFDDIPAIVDRVPAFETFTSYFKAFYVAGQQRTLLFSLALSQWLSPLDPTPGAAAPWSYHAFNLIIHLIAALALFGIVRRTLLRPGLVERFGSAANGLALISALLFLLHPIQTQAVTYIIQRAQALMGMFHLLALYFVIRGFCNSWL
jgi:protein O-mannosyl-transferase